MNRLIALIVLVAGGSLVGCTSQEMSEPMAFTSGTSMQTGRYSYKDPFTHDVTHVGTEITTPDGHRHMEFTKLANNGGIKNVLPAAVAATGYAVGQDRRRPDNSSVNVQNGVSSSSTRGYVNNVDNSSATAHSDSSSAAASASRSHADSHSDSQAAGGAGGHGGAGGSGGSVGNVSNHQSQGQHQQQQQQSLNSNRNDNR